MANIILSSHANPANTKHYLTCSQKTALGSKATALVTVHNCIPVGDASIKNAHNHETIPIIVPNLKMKMSCIEQVKKEALSYEEIYMHEVRQ